MDVTMSSWRDVIVMLQVGWNSGEASVECDGVTAGSESIGDLMPRNIWPSILVF